MPFGKWSTDSRPPLLGATRTIGRRRVWGSCQAKGTPTQPGIYRLYSTRWFFDRKGVTRDLRFARIKEKSLPWFIRIPDTETLCQNADYLRLNRPVPTLYVNPPPKLCSALQHTITNTDDKARCSLDIGCRQGHRRRRMAP